MDIGHWDAVIHHGIQLTHYCDRTRSWNSTLLRSPAVYSIARRFRNTKVYVWTHESMGWVLESGHQPFGRGNSLWRSACPTLWSNPILELYFTEIAPCVLPCLKSQEHQSTCVDSWVHWVLENGHQPMGRGNSLWRSAVSENTSTTYVMVKTLNDICVYFTSTRNIHQQGILVFLLYYIPFCKFNSFARPPFVLSCPSLASLPGVHNISYVIYIYIFYIYIYIFEHVSQLWTYGQPKFSAGWPAINFANLELVHHIFKIPVLLLSPALARW